MWEESLKSLELLLLIKFCLKGLTLCCNGFSRTPDGLMHLWILWFVLNSGPSLSIWLIDCMLHTNMLFHLTVSLQQVQWHWQLQQWDPPLYNTGCQANNPNTPNPQAHSSVADRGQGPGRRAVQWVDHILQPAGYWLVVPLLLHCLISVWLSLIFCYSLLLSP